MPKENIDYSNTIIYKIYCIDNTISHVYVGHTTNFIKRKYQHKNCSNNLNNKLKIYEIIRQNGGWNNWDMVEIAKYNCKNKTEARIKEQYHFEELKATLNSCPPCADKIKYLCLTCNIQCNSPEVYETHINCNDNKIQVSNIIDNNSNSFCKKSMLFCEKCEYITNNKKDFKKHLLTTKHYKLTNIIIEPTIKTQNKEVNKFICKKCSEQYYSRVSLWRHKKKCELYNKTNIHQDNNNNNDNNSNNVIIDKELIMMLMKENSELRKIVCDQSKESIDLHP